VTDLLISPLADVTLKTIQANGITMRYAEAGSGPLVLFCHGWPESWYSWRHLIKAVSAAGFRAVAPDMRGFGGTEAPAEIERYTQLHAIGDMVELVKQLGESSAVIVGHDWGAPVAWGAAMLRPDVFRAVIGMSVPWSPPGYVDLLSALEKMGVTTFYMQYFQQPGVAEAEFEKDVRNTLRRIYYSGSGDGRSEGKGFGMLRAGGGFLDNTTDPPTLPAWLSDSDLDYYVAQFQRTGFRGGLNWYRNVRRSWELYGAWRG
jgi:pimeloyl-ACP methyl ester carboxylesterase